MLPEAGVCGGAAWHDPGMAQEFRNQLIRIADLVVTSDVIEDSYFENVELVGPAVLIPLEDAFIRGCNFDAPDPDALFWAIDDDREDVLGAIGLRRSTFLRCRFSRVGLAAKRADLPTLRRGFGLE